MDCKVKSILGGSVFDDVLGGIFNRCLKDLGHK